MDRKVQSDIFKLLLSNKQSSSAPESLDADYLLSQSQSSSNFKSKQNVDEEFYAVLLQAGKVIAEVENLQKENKEIKQQLKDIENALESKLSEIDENNKKVLDEIRKEREAIEKSNEKISEEYNEISKPRKSFYETSRSVYILIYVTYVFFAVGVFYVNADAMQKLIETMGVSNGFWSFIFVLLLQTIPGGTLMFVLERFFTTKNVFPEDTKVKK